MSEVENQEYLMRQCALPSCMVNIELLEGDDRSMYDIDCKIFGCPSCYVKYTNMPISPLYRIIDKDLESINVKYVSHTYVFNPNIPPLPPRTHCYTINDIYIKNIEIDFENWNKVVGVDTSFTYTIVLENNERIQRITSIPTTYTCNCCGIIPAPKGFKLA